jgi:glycosyltransferase involved in cell wall biosynthesis
LFSVLRVFVIGTRGFPDIQGGVEQHCESLYPLLASDECQITVFRRSPYVADKTKEFDNIIFKDLPSTKIPGFEAFYHSFLASLICIIKRPDIVHVHNIGPGFFISLLKAAGLIVILTYHSPNYEHTKWSWFSRLLLKFSEFMSVKFSDEVIFVSLYQMEKLGNKANFVHINNGVKAIPIVNDDDYIRELGLQKKKYILAVGRFVEEKGFDLLINAYSNIKDKVFHLVIAGDSDHETVYSTRLKELAKKHNVILPGFVRGMKLQQLYVHAGLFVLPSYNEGQPLSLLEAMSCNLPVLASNIPANLQVSLPVDSYFASGDINSLTEILDKKLHSNLTEVKYDMTEYNWNHIAVQTKELYLRLLKK